MSKKSSADMAAIEQELDATLTQLAEPVEHSAAQLLTLDAQLLANRFRTLLKQAMKREQQTTKGLAHKLGVSPSAVSRQLQGEGDMKVFTAAALANALKHSFHIDLIPLSAVEAPSSNWNTLVVTSDAGTGAGSGSGGAWIRQSEPATGSFTASDGPRHKLVRQVAPTS